MAITKAVILAAGDGKRMQPLTDARNKSLMPVANKPIISRSLAALKAAGVSEAILVVNPNSELQALLGTMHEGVSLSYAVQPHPLGTAHAISMASGYVSEDFLVINGDDLCSPAHIKQVIHTHKSTATVSVIKKENPLGFGIVQIEGGFVKGIAEKPKNIEGSHFVNIGIYAFSPVIFSIIKNLKKSVRGEYEITDAIQNIIKKGDAISAVEADAWLPINYPWDLLAVTKKFIDEMPASEEGAAVEERVSVKGKLIAGTGTLIKSGVYIEGPVMIGKNCTIGPNAFLRPYACIGDNCKIGQGVEVKNSIIMEGTMVPHLSYVGDSVIGRNVNFGAGAITANLRHDEKNVKAKVKGDVIDSGLRKLGAIVGDDVKFGSNVVINPGKKIGARARVWPSVVVNEDIPADAEYKGLSQR